ncbi:hypothetical protein Tco_1139843, partial [Tanacetum coccineum]
YIDTMCCDDIHSCLRLAFPPWRGVTSTSGDVSLAEPNQVSQPPGHLRNWTKDHPLDNIVVLSCLGSSKEAKEPNLQISVDTLHNTNFFRALTASADVPSSVTETTDTTSTLQPPPPPLQKPTVHRDIW